MPKLLLFVPCERVIVSVEGPISLITVLEKINVNIPEDEEANLPSDAVVPISWHVVTKWQREDNEVAERYEQRITLTLANGRIPTDSIAAFELTEKPGARNILAVNGFPFSPAGQCTLTVSLRIAGEDDAAWREIATYPIEVVRVRPAPA
jgi:hypothetical protein